MQQKIHMQDQVNDRVEMIMKDHKWLTHVIEDCMTFGLIATILAIGIIW